MLKHSGADPKGPARLAANIERIAAYTARHPELKSAHHFLYDLRSPPDGLPRFVVMGINPGETKRDWDLSPTPTEETSRFDFHRRAEPSGSALRWARLAGDYLDHADYVLAEVFFWSSPDLRVFGERFGPLAKSPHLDFCRDMNRDLIEVYQPEAVVAPGLGSAGLCARLYGLTPLRTIQDAGARVAEIYCDGVRPWVFTKHWTGAFGLTAVQKRLIQDAIRQAVREGVPAGFASPQAQAQAHKALTTTTRLQTDRGRALVEDKLSACHDWVRTAFARLDTTISAASSLVVEENNGPGLRYLRATGKGWIIKLHPKSGHIAIGFPDSMREAVRATGLLRGQQGAAWVNFDPAVSPEVIDLLVRRSLAGS
ncbi:MAG: hypothetical protein GC145_03875 [Caulobacter sp.]|nr:hypothetical protein [Caulobacter sp.]